MHSSMVSLVLTQDFFLSGFPGLRSWGLWGCGMQGERIRAAGVYVAGAASWRERVYSGYNNKKQLVEM